jgi:hypothetical protein
MCTVLLILGLASATPHPKPQRFDFENDEVIEGTAAHGEDELMFARKRDHFGSLIHLRSDFKSELLRSADEH